VSPRPVDTAAAKLAGAGVLAAVVLAAGRLLAQGLRRLPLPHGPVPRSRPPGAWRRESRDLHAAAAALCASVLADSAVEHYRGSFENPGMVAPLAASALAIVAGIDAAIAARLPSPMRRGGYRLAAAVGAAGLGFHLYDVQRRPGGFGWLNLFYAAPLGAPAALVLAGILGLAAERVGADSDGASARMAGLPPGRALCAVVAAGLAGTVGEVALLHYRGSFQNPFMWLPVSLPPVAAALTAKAAIDRSGRRDRRFTRAWLWLTALLGVGGVGFHAWGVSRAMAGWRNWRQNLLDGPPLPAPPAFSALALAGLAALRLRERDGG